MKLVTITRADGTEQAIWVLDGLIPVEDADPGDAEHNTRLIHTAADGISEWARIRS